MRAYGWFLTVVGMAINLAVLGMIVGSIGMNWYVHSDAFRQEVEARAGQSLGGKVEIQRIDFNIWSGVVLNGFATKLETQQGTLVTQVASVQCSYSLSALLSRKLQVDSLTVVKPQVMLTQAPISTVAAPSASEKPQQLAQGGSVNGVSNSSNMPVQVILQRAKISDGQLTIHDATGAMKADLQGIQVNADTSGYTEGKDVTGEMRVSKVALPQNLNLTDFHTPFTYRAGGAIEARPFAATAFAGQITGGYKLESGGSSLLEVNATGLDMAQLGQAAHPGATTTLSGALALQSKWHGVETGKLTGEGDAQITGAKLTGVTLLHDLSMALHVKGLDDPDLKTVSTHFEVAEGTTHFDHLEIESADFGMSGSGTIDAEGHLNADMMLALHAEAMSVIPGEAAAFFSKSSDGAGSIPFHLTGTVANPKADLNTRMFLKSSEVQKTVKKALNELFH